MAILNSGEVNDVVSHFHIYTFQCLKDYQLHTSNQKSHKGETFWGVYHICGLI